MLRHTAALALRGQLRRMVIVLTMLHVAPVHAHAETIVIV